MWFLSVARVGGPEGGRGPAPGEASLDRRLQAQPCFPAHASGALRPGARSPAPVVSSVQVTRDSHTYSVGVCTAAAGLDEGGCKDGGVCLLSGSKGASFGRLASMRLDYRHQDEAVILTYANGDSCPPGNARQRGALTFPVRVTTQRWGAGGLRSGAAGPVCRCGDCGWDHRPLRPHGPGSEGSGPEMRPTPGREACRSQRCSEGGQPLR